MATAPQKIKQIQSYSTKGQIGYISPQERFSSRFEWQYQNPKAYKLKLYSLISKTTLTMEMHPNGMTISDNKGNQQSDKMPNYCYAKSSEWMCH